MNAPQSPTPPTTPRELFSAEVARKEQRLLKAQRRGPVSVLSGFAACGRIGWSIAVPTLLGALIGSWLDRNYPMPHSWTITMIGIGVAVGGRNAWNWVTGQHDTIKKQDDGHE